MSDKTIEQLNAENEVLKAELEMVKTERTNAKTEATKTANKLVKVQTELDSLKEENQLLKQELENQSAVLEEVKTKALKEKNKELTDELLKERAARIMKQKEVDECFITTEKGFVFTNESSAKNNSNGKYKIAQLLDGKVVLKNPAK